MIALRGTFLKEGPPHPLKNFYRFEPPSLHEPLNTSHISVRTLLKKGYDTSQKF